MGIEENKNPWLRLSRPGMPDTVVEFPQHLADPFPALQYVFDKLDQEYSDEQQKSISHTRVRESAYERCVRMLADREAAK